MCSIKMYFKQIKELNKTIKVIIKVSEKNTEEYLS